LRRYAFHMDDAVRLSLAACIATVQSTLIRLS
jgi:hypothetical protein